MPSVVSRAREPKPTNRMHASELIIASPTCTRALFRLLSARAPRQAVLRASFWLAPCWFHHRALRPDGGQDAKCVRPTSATHACCLRAPAPRAFPAHSATFVAWAPRGLWVPRGLTGGPGVSHHPIRFGGPSSDTLLEPRVLSVAGGGSRAWALSSHGAGSTEPLTSLSPLPLLVRAHAPSSVLGVTRSTPRRGGEREGCRVDRTRRKPPRPP